MQKTRSLAVFCLSHLVVDFACLHILTGGFARVVADPADVSVGFLLYCFIAFALQAPIGFIVDDKAYSPYAVSICGCLLCAVALAPLPVWISLVICAFGNALFHIGAGADVLARSGGKHAPSGFLISFGAIGVTIGTLTGSSGSVQNWIVLLPLLLCVALQWGFCRLEAADMKPVASAPVAVIRSDGAVIFLLLLCIVIRALVGVFTYIPWKATVFLSLLPTLSVFAGKFLGGIVSDRLGARATAVISLLLSAPLLSFFSHNILLCCIGLLLFNMTTAITLCLVFDRLPGYPGFSLGLTTLALFAGTSVSYFTGMPPTIRIVFILSLTLLSTVAIALAAPRIFLPPD